MINLLRFGFPAGPFGAALWAGWNVGSTLIRFHLTDNPAFWKMTVEPRLTIEGNDGGIRRDSGVCRRRGERWFFRGSSDAWDLEIGGEQAH